MTTSGYKVQPLSRLSDDGCAHLASDDRQRVSANNNNNSSNNNNKEESPCNNISPEIVPNIQIVNDVEESVNLNINTSSTDHNFYINYNNTDDITNNNDCDNNDELLQPLATDTSLKFHKHCDCNCKCINTCFCRTPFCSQSNDYNMYHATLSDYINTLLIETTLLNNDDSLPRPSITIEMLNRLILELHVRNGHHNFQKIISEFRDGYYDEDIVRSSKITYHNLTELKLLSRTQLSHRNFSCIDCTLTKIRGKNHAKVSSRPVGNTPFRKGYVDIIGPFPPGKGGIKYYYLYICDDSSYGLIEAATGKDFVDDIKPTITAWRLFARDNNWKMDSLHFDSDPIFLASELQNWLKTLDVSCHYAPPGQHWKNGLVEAFNKVIQYTGLTMLRASGLPAEYWFFAMQYAVELYNNTYNKRLNRNTYFKMKPNDYVFDGKLVRKFPIFGQHVCARDPKANEIGKLEYRGRECAYLGYDRQASSHILLHLRSGRILRSADVVVISNLYAYNRKPIINDQFQRVVGSSLNHIPAIENQPSATADELNALAPANNSGDSETAQIDRLSPLQLRKVHFDRSPHDVSPSNIVLLVLTVFIDYIDTQLPTTNTVNDNITNNNNIIVMNTALSSKYLGIGITYSEYLTQKDIRDVISKAEDPYDEYELMCLAAIPQRKRKTQLVNGELLEIPRNYEDSMAPEFNGFWNKANEDEISVIIDKGCLGPPLKDKPPEKLIITTKFDYRIKTKKDGSIDKPKARCVVRGFMQKFGVHYFETYAPTLMKDSVRIILYLVAIGFHPMIIDVKGAFLCAPADTLLYTELTPGMPGYNSHVQQWAQILTSWYGTHQAGKLWNDLLISVLPTLGYTRCENDHALWHRRCEKGLLSIMGTFVDDMPGASQDPMELDRLITALESHFEITYKPTFEKILGLLIHVNSNGDVVAYNDFYFDDLAASLDLSDVKTSKSFGDSKVHFQPNTTAKPPPQFIKKYQKLIGGLLWPALQWRPDINHIVTQLGRFTHNPSFEHFDAAVLVLRYCLGTKRLGLCYRKSTLPIPNPLQLSMLGYYDSDWASDWDRISNSGVITTIAFPADITCGEQTGNWPNYNILDYIARKQHGFAASSSAAAEAKAGSVATQHITGERRLLTELGLMAENDPPTWLLGDNDATTINYREDRTTPKNRSYELDCVIFRTGIKNKMVKPGKISSSLNLADSQTKVQAVPDRDRAIQRMMTVAESGLSHLFPSQDTNDQPHPSGTKR